MAASSLRRLLSSGPSAATVMGTSSRRRWCHTVVACEEETMKRQARVEVTLSLEGFEASELKAILPLVHQRLGVAEARQAVYNQMASISQAPGFVDKQVQFACDSKVTYKGYEDSEMKSLEDVSVGGVTQHVTPVETPREADLVFEQRFFMNKMGSGRI